VPELRQHERLLVVREGETGAEADASIGPGLSLRYQKPRVGEVYPSYQQGPVCACGGATVWDGHKYRCHGCGLYYETCCDGGRCR
jgi:hypothetical protein